MRSRLMCFRVESEGWQQKAASEDDPLLEKNAAVTTRFASVHDCVCLLRTLVELFARNTGQRTMPGLVPIDDLLTFLLHGGNLIRRVHLHHAQCRFVHECIER